MTSFRKGRDRDLRTLTQEEAELLSETDNGASEAKYKVRTFKAAERVFGVLSLFSRPPRFRSPRQYLTLQLQIHRQRFFQKSVGDAPLHPPIKTSSLGFSVNWSCRRLRRQRGASRSPAKVKRLHQRPAPLLGSVGGLRFLSQSGWEVGAGGSRSQTSLEASAEGVADGQETGGQKMSARSDVPLPRSTPATTVRWLAWKRLGKAIRRPLMVFQHQ